MQYYQSQINHVINTKKTLNRTKNAPIFQLLLYFLYYKLVNHNNLREQFINFFIFFFFFCQRPPTYLFVYL